MFKDGEMQELPFAGLPLAYQTASIYCRRAVIVMLPAQWALGEDRLVVTQLRRANVLQEPQV